jgi:hypothetical protein
MQFIEKPQRDLEYSNDAVLTDALSKIIFSKLIIAKKFYDSFLSTMKSKCNDLFAIAVFEQHISGLDNIYTKLSTNLNIDNFPSYYYSLFDIVGSQMTYTIINKTDKHYNVKLMINFQGKFKIGKVQFDEYNDFKGRFLFHVFKQF